MPCSLLFGQLLDRSLACLFDLRFKSESVLDVVIQVTGLGKQYVIGREQPDGNTALRDRFHQVEVVPSATDSSIVLLLCET